MKRFESSRPRPRTIVKPPELRAVGMGVPSALLWLIVCALVGFALGGCQAITPDEVSVGYFDGRVTGDTRLANDLGLADSDAFGLESEFDASAVVLLLTWDLQERATASQLRRMEERLGRALQLLLDAQK